MRILFGYYDGIINVIKCYKNDLNYVQGTLMLQCSYYDAGIPFEILNNWHYTYY